MKGTAGRAHSRQSINTTPLLPPLFLKLSLYASPPEVFQKSGLVFKRTDLTVSSLRGSDTTQSGTNASKEALVSLFL